MAAVLLVPVMLGVALWCFDRHGLPMRNLTSRSQISGGTYALAPADAGYLWLQLLLLLAPTVALVPALLAERDLLRQPRAGSSAWRPRRATSCVLTHFTGDKQFRYWAPWIVLLIVLAATHTAAWTARNHTFLA